MPAHDVDELRIAGMKLGAEALDAIAQGKIRDRFVVIQQVNMSTPVKH